MADGAMYRMFPALALLCAVPLAGCGTAKPEEPPLAGARIGGPFTLTDQDGKTVRDTDFAGKYRIVYFGYTYCPDVCPTDMAKIGQAMKILDKEAPRVAAKVVPIFITVDPMRDTPEKLKMYLSAFEGLSTSRPNFVGLTGTAEEIEQAADAYEVFYQAHLDGRFGGDEGYSVDHSGNVYLMDPEGKFVSYYSQGISPDELAADLMMKIPPG